MSSVYIHIPFCKSICSYCDFAKIIYNEEQVIPYLNSLALEIEDAYGKEEINTLYIGGGTPSSLSDAGFDALSQILNKFNLAPNAEFTFECNIEDVSETLLIRLKELGVNRLSIGIESFNAEKLKFMNRKSEFSDVSKKISLARMYGFNNINLDLMYGIPNETYKDLKKDLKMFLKLNPEHISTYSLIIEEHTMCKVREDENIDPEIEIKMYEYIRKKLKKKGYIHYEISNFAHPGYESKHNLVYWNNEEYYGFGLGASGYINGFRYENTHSINSYIDGNYKLEESLISKSETMENEIMLGLRKIKGINLQEFYDKYGINLQDAFPVKPLIKSKELIYENGYIRINPKYIYVMNEILLKLI